MENETMEAPAVQPSGDLTSNNLPPESPLPLPEPGFGWLKEAGNVVAEPPPVSPGFATHQPRAEEQSRTASATKRFGLLNRRSSIKAITAIGAVGIAVLIYAEFSSDKSAVADMLGTELIKLVPESVPVPRADLGSVDPRLADPVALDMLQLKNQPLASGTTEPAPTEGLMAPTVPSEESPEVASPHAGPSADSMVPPEVPATEPAGAPGTAPSTSTATAPVAPPAQAAAASAPTAPGVTNEELMLRLQRVELLLAQLQLQAKAAPAAPATTPAASSTATAAPPVTTQRRAEPAARPAPARMVKTAPAKPVKQAKAAASAPAAAPAPVLGGQLVSVDMWNGEASVVIASGLPGDRRVRVLRPGDVVNGMALRSADPVTRSATFVAPGSQGLTLYVSQGG